METKKTEVKVETTEQRAPWLVRQAVGTAIIGGIGAAGGAIWHLYKQKPLMSGIKGGALLGVIGSIGFAGEAYNAVFAKKKTTFTSLIEEERTKEQSAAKVR